MTKPAHQILSEPSRILMPDEEVIPSGHKYRPGDDTWRFELPIRIVYLHVGEFREWFSEELMLSLRIILILSLRNNIAPSTVGSRLIALKKIIKADAENQSLPIGELDVVHFFKDNGEALRIARPLLRDWFEEGLGGVSSNLWSFLKKRKIKKYDRAVTVYDPDNGALSDTDAQTVRRRVTRGYMVDGTVSLSEYLAFDILFSTGLRAGSLSLLRCSDKKDTTLFVPGLKNNSWGQPYPLQNFVAAEVDKWIEERLKDNPGKSLDELSFLNWGNVTSTTITKRLSDVVKRLKIMGENGKPLKFGAVRMRHYIGTRMAEDGYSSEAIARRLDHSATDNVKVYVDHRPEHDDLIDRATKRFIAPLAEAFEGKVIDEDLLVIPGTEMEEIYALVGNEKIGVCGCLGPCSLVIPLACYTCPSFRAKKTARHDLMYEKVSVMRQEALARSKNHRIAEALLRTLQAITHCMKECIIEVKSEIV